MDRRDLLLLESAITAIDEAASAVSREGVQILRTHARRLLQQGLHARLNLYLRYTALDPAPSPEPPR